MSSSASSPDEMGRVGGVRRNRHRPARPAVPVAREVLIPESELERHLLYQLKVLKIEAPERQYHFAPSRRWAFDFAWPTRMLAVEVEGGTWVAGRHTRGKGFEADAEKYNEAVCAGWRILRMTTDMVTDGRGVAFLERLLRS